MKSTGTIVATETITNISRPPNLSVSAPARIRPTDPTITGTATMRATCDSLSTPRVPPSRKTGPSGLRSAHAQKLMANPMVAIASIDPGDRVAAPAGTTLSLAWLLCMRAPLTRAPGGARPQAYLTRRRSRPVRA